MKTARTLRTPVPFEKAIALKPSDWQAQAELAAVLRAYETTRVLELLPSSAKPHYQIWQIAPPHFFQAADQAGVGRGVVGSVVAELVERGAAAVDSAVSNLPESFPDQIASSIAAGINQRLRLLEGGGTIKQ